MYRNVRNNDFTTRNLLDYFCYQKYYKLIGIHLSGPTNTSVPPTNKFCRKIRMMVQRCFLLLESSEKLF